MTSLTFLSLLLLTTVVSNISAQGGLRECCFGLTNRPGPQNQLTGYHEVKRPVCGRHAVIFTTILGRRICADPESLWTKKSMTYLDEKNYYHRMRTKMRMCHSKPLTTATTRTTPSSIQTHGTHETQLNTSSFSRTRRP